MVVNPETFKRELNDNWTCVKCAVCGGRLVYKCYGPHSLEIHIRPNDGIFRLFERKMLKDRGKIEDMRAKVDGLIEIINERSK